MLIALQLQLRAHPLAEQLYKRCVSDNEFPVDALCTLGIPQAERGDTEVAWESLRCALSADPAHSLTHFAIGNIHLDHGDYARSRYALESAAQAAADPDVFFNLGLACVLCHDASAARLAMHSHRRTGGHRARELTDCIERSPVIEPHVDEIVETVRRLRDLERIARHQGDAKREWHIGKAVEELVAILAGSNRAPVATCIK